MDGFLLDKRRGECLVHTQEWRDAWLLDAVVHYDQESLRIERVASSLLASISIHKKNTMAVSIATTADTVNTIVAVLATATAAAVFAVVSSSAGISCSIPRDASDNRLAIPWYNLSTVAEQQVAAATIARRAGASVGIFCSTPQDASGSKLTIPWCSLFGLEQELELESIDATDSAIELWVASCEMLGVMSEPKSDTDCSGTTAVSVAVDAATGEIAAIATTVGTTALCS